MASGAQKRTRQQRVAAVELPPGFWKTSWSHLQRGGVLLRLGLCALVALFLWVFTRGWDPPFSYRLDDVVRRSIVARVSFRQPDPETTEKNQNQAREETIATYDQDPKPLVQLRAKLRTEISNLLAAETLSDLAPEAWQRFLPTPAPNTPAPTRADLEAQFQRFRALFAEENALETYSQQVAQAMEPFDQHGLLAALPPEHDANLQKIGVQSSANGAGGAQLVVNVADVLITDEAAAKLQKDLNDRIPDPELAAMTFAWLRPQLPSTLTLNQAATKKDQDEAVAEVEPAFFERTKDEYVIAKAGETLTADELALLRLEYDTEIAQRTAGQRIGRSAAVLGMFVALYTLAGFYLYVRERRVLDELLRMVSLLGLFAITVTLASIVNWYAWGADIIPLLLFAMIVAVAYQQEMSLLLSACVTLVVVVTLGHGLGQALVWSATVSGAIIVLRQVRTRSKLLLVGFTAAGVGFFTTLGVGTLYGQDAGTLLQNGFTVALWSVIAGSLMTVLLPTVEKVFGVQTDLSLIELGDPAHPLLQELIRRAPGTYNHSITVASLAEAAAESIGARGLLVRVGAYFHDIGKMLKPQYFIENQSKGDNRHDTLVPAMSTLVIIAHVKDGADLARQNRLPESIVDFIQQHHGTTLVEFFYRQANQRKAQENPDAAALDESSFRYPGPKPQSREAGVLMLADAVESASRVLKEPTPSRIENLVEEISMKRLLDGQFDESGLTLEEVRKIGESLVKSLTAVYHGRVKYPDQVTA
ncbi:MAG TPA: HDIG domain-containing protein [Lacipirellulaceae bacterium]|nr:HDIG domain-containing protein [Lacipirellulaceae bacterium]